MPPPAPPPNFEKYRDAVTSPDNMTTPATAVEADGAGGGGGGGAAEDAKVSEIKMYA